MTTPAGPAARPGGPLAGKRKQRLIVGGSLAGGVVIFALYERSKKSAAAGTAGGGSTPTGATMTTAGTATPYSYQGGYGDYSSQLAGLQEQLAQITASQNPAPAALASGTGPAWLQGLVGTPLPQALQTLQNNGIAVNTVLNNAGQSVSPAAAGSSAVGSVTYFGPGKAGSNFANSVTLGLQ